MIVWAIIFHFDYHGMRTEIKQKRNVYEMLQWNLTGSHDLQVVIQYSFLAVVDYTYPISHLGTKYIEKEIKYHNMEWWKQITPQWTIASLFIKQGA